MYLHGVRIVVVILEMKLYHKIALRKGHTDYGIETIVKSHTQPSTNAAIKRSNKCSERIFAKVVIRSPSWSFSSYLYLIVTFQNLIEQLLQNITFT